MLLGHTPVDDTSILRIADINSPQNYTLSLVQIQGIIYINSYSRKFLEKLEKEMGMQGDAIIDTTGRERMYNGAHGFLLPTKYKTLARCMHMLQNIHKTKSIVFTLTNTDKSK